MNLVGKARVSPLRPRCVLASGVATVFSAPARIMMKKEYLVASEVIKTKLVRSVNISRGKPGADTGTKYINSIINQLLSLISDGNYNAKKVQNQPLETSDVNRQC